MEILNLDDGREGPGIRVLSFVLGPLLLKGGNRGADQSRRHTVIRNRQRDWQSLALHLAIHRRST